MTDIQLLLIASIIFIASTVPKALGWYIGIILLLLAIGLRYFP